MQQFSLTQRTSTMISAAVAAVVVSVGFLLSASHAYAVAPTMLSGATNTFVEDATGDGTVDKITITFSAAVNINDSALDGFPNLALSNSCTIPTGDYSSASTTTLVITGLTGCTAGNTALTPTVTYTALGNCVGDGTICDQATDLDEMANGANVTSSDKAKPAILTATTGDNNSDGTVDRLVLTFSESVNITTGGADNDFTLVASSGTATLVAAGYASPDTTMTYTITASATGNTSLTVAPTYVVAGAGSIIDVNSNEMNNGETVAGTDGAKPAVLTAATRDNTADGSIDQLVLTFSESVVITDGGTDNDFTLVASSGTATITAAAYGATASTLTYTITTSVTGDTSLTVTPTYATAGAGSITDASLTEMNNGETVAGTDGAKPVFMSASPASGTAASRSSSLTMTMSETVASATATTNSGVTLTCTISTVTITCVPNHAFNVGTSTITLATAPDASSNALNATSVATNPYNITFTGTSTSSSTSTAETYSLDITAPEADDAVTQGSSLDIAWTSTGSAMTVVDISYSYDGVTYTTVADNTTNDGSYTMTVPSTSGEMTLLLSGSDLATALATDSVTVTVSASETDGDEDAEDEDVTAPSTGTTGLSPVTGEVEDISEVSVGDYIKSPYFSTIYYVDSGSVRRPFLDAQTFMTYQDDFDGVITVTDATLPTLTLGTPMLPKDGAVLVKIQSDAKVYFVEENTDGEMELRWITSEDVAIDMFGSSWADYVIDVNVTLFPRYESGSDIDDAFTVDMNDMKTRVEVNAS